MGQTLLSSLFPASPLLEAAKTAELKTKDSTAAPVESAKDNAFSTFLKRRREDAASDRADRAEAKLPSRTARSPEKIAAKEKPDSADKLEAKQSDDKQDDSAERDHDVVTEATDASATDTASSAEKPDRREDSVEVSDAAAADPSRDVTTESIALSFLVGQTQPVPPAPTAGGFAAADIAGSATSAPAPIPTPAELTGSTTASIPSATDTTKTTDFAALLASPAVSEQPAANATPTVAPLVPTPSPMTDPASLTLQQTTSTPSIAATPAATVTPISTDTDSDDDFALKPVDTAPATVEPRRIGKLSPAAIAQDATPAAPSAMPAPPPVLAQAARAAEAPKAETEQATTIAPATGTAETSALANAGNVSGSRETTGAKFELASSSAATSAADQIVAHVATLPKGKGSQFTIQLDPLHLGKVEVVMDIQRNGSLHMQIRAESKETLDALQQDRASLERSLQDLGLKTDGSSLQFSLKQEGQPQQSFAELNEAAAARSRALGASSTAEAPVQRSTVIYRSVRSDGLDIHV